MYTFKSKTGYALADISNVPGFIGLWDNAAFNLETDITWDSRDPSGPRHVVGETVITPGPIELAVAGDNPHVIDTSLGALPTNVSGLVGPRRGVTVVAFIDVVAVAADQHIFCWSNAGNAHQLTLFVSDEEFLVAELTNGIGTIATWGIPLTAGVEQFVGLQMRKITGGWSGTPPASPAWRQTIIRAFWEEMWQGIDDLGVGTGEAAWESQAGVPDTNVNRFTVGGQVPAARTFDGKIYAFSVFNRWLSDEQLFAVRHWLRTTYSGTTGIDFGA